MKISPIEVTYVNHCGSDLTVVNAARVSFHKESTEFVAQDEKLINYLARHKHHSPFNHAFLSFRVKAPVFVARQLVKHKFMPWNEVSRRYVDDEPEFFLPDTWRARPESSVKQGSGDRTIQICDEDGYNPVDHNTWCANQLYKDLVNRGVAPEQARMVLPQNMMTEWYWSGTLGAFGDMLKLRLDPHTQKESRDVAELIRDEVAKLFPVSLKAMLEN